MAKDAVPMYRRVADNIYVVSDLVRDKKRKLPYRVHIHFKGRHYVKMFPTLEEAKIWRDDRWRLLRMPREQRLIEEMQDTKVSDLCMTYRETVLRKGRDGEAKRLLKFASLPIAQKSIYDFDQRDADAYIESRLSEIYTNKGWKVSRPISPSTVAREKTIFRRMWNVSKRTHPKLDNPWIGGLEEYANIPRNRTLENDEHARLIAHCKGCYGLNKVYVPLAICLAVDTAMRQQEIFNLTWKDINFFDRTIHIAKSKTDRENAKKGLPPGRTVVLPLFPMLFLSDLSSKTTGKTFANTNERVFPLTMAGKDPKTAFTQAWRDLRKRAGIQYINGEILEFRDLRRAANSKFEEAGLTAEEQKIMLGHSFRDITEVYRDYRVRMRRLILIMDKLDKVILGETLEQMLERSKIQIHEDEDWELAILALRHRLLGRDGMENIIKEAEKEIAE